MNDVLLPLALAIATTVLACGVLTAAFAAARSWQLRCANRRRSLQA